MSTLVKYAILAGSGCVVIFIALAGYFILKDPGADPSQCMTADNIPGICMDLNNCSSTTRYSGADRSSLSSQLQGNLNFTNCTNYSSIPMVCCPLEIPTVKINKTKIVPASSAAPSSKLSPVDITRHPSYRLLPTSCGDSGTDDKIIGGRKTALFQYPWMALIMHHIGEFTTEACGATIINEFYILTAAHCITNLPKGISVAGVRIGEYDLSTDDDCEGIGRSRTCAPSFQDFEDVELIPHANYNNFTRQNDIALVQLNEKIDFMASVQPICLPTAKETADMNLIGQVLTVTGWGLVDDNNTSDILMEAEVPVVSNERCADLYRRSEIIITHKQICAGGVEGVDSCNGDSGGPLQMLARNGPTLSMFQYGIVSVGPEKCGTAGKPGVYTRVTSFMNWILDNMKPVNTSNTETEKR